MCRLAYIPGKCPVKRTTLLKLLDGLQESFGGDGNGFVAISPDDTQCFHNKGVKLTNAEIIQDVMPMIRNNWSVYYHTRKISVGWSSDEQCHPHKISGNKFAGFLSHNGTWYDGIALANYIGVGSDTAALAHIIGRFGIKAAKDRGLFPSSGVFLLYGRGRNETPLHRVMKIKGDLKYCPNSRIWASEFNKDWPFPSAYSVANGEHLLCKPAPRAVTVGTSKTHKSETSKSQLLIDLPFKQESLSEKLGPLYNSNGKKINGGYHI